MSFTRDLASAWSHNDSNGARRQLRLPRRYSAWSLLRHGLTGEDWPRAWRTHDLKESYDVVIIGAGAAGMTVLRSAPAEVEQYKHFDYVILNDDINRASAQLASVIYAERARRERQEVQLKETLLDFGSVSIGNGQK